MTYDPAANSLACWELAIACLRADHEAGRRLTNEERLAEVERMRGGADGRARMVGVET